MLKPRLLTKFNFKFNRCYHQQQYKRFNSSGTSPSTKYLLLGSTSLLGAYYYIHLEKVPISERTRFMNVSPSEESRMSEIAYKEIIQQYRHKMLNKYHPISIYIKKVANRIIQVSGMDDLNWEINVINDEQPNAFVLPGGKVFVFTGILKVADTEDAIAVILGHEIAHQLARHSAEKLSFNKLVMYGGILLSFFIDPTFLMNRLVLELGLFLPFSRKCETEADEVGLILTSKACYNPQEAIRVWQRMGELEGALGKVAFLSTHPSSSSRMNNLKEKIPNALRIQELSDCHTTYGLLQEFNKMNMAKW